MGFNVVYIIVHHGKPKQPWAEFQPISHNRLEIWFSFPVIRASRTSPTLLMDIDLTSGTSSELSEWVGE